MTLSTVLDFREPQAAEVCDDSEAAGEGVLK